MHGMLSGAPKHYVECFQSNLHLHEPSQRREWCQDVDRKTADNRWRRSMHHVSCKHVFIFFTVVPSYTS